HQRGEYGQDREAEEPQYPGGEEDPAPQLLLALQGVAGRRPARRCGAYHASRAHPTLPSVVSGWWCSRGALGPPGGRSESVRRPRYLASSNKTCRSARSLSISASTSTPGWLSSSDLKVSRRSLARLWFGIGVSWLGTSS